MTTSSQTWRWTYEPNGVTASFAFDNLVLSADELIVRWWSAAGAELALPSHSVTGLGQAAGGAVVFAAAPAAAAGSLIEILRKTTPLQEAEFEDFLQESAAARQERSDRQFLLAQELRGLLDRALLFSPLDPAGPFRIPAPSVRANKALMFGPGPLAQLTVGSPLTPGSLVVSAFVQTLLDDNDADTFLGSLGYSAFVKSLKAAVDGPAFRALIGAVDAGSLLAEPRGRLTLASGVRFMGGAAHTGKTVLYYTGGVVPIWNGAAFVPTLVGELQNDLTQAAANKAGPAAAGPYQVIDAVVWNDAGTPRLTRLPRWIRSSVVTMTLAAPCVVSWANHGLAPGQTVRFATTGALPTGVAAATEYFVAPIDANSFRISTTLANMVSGTYVTSSGAQGGVHTAENYTTERGAGVGTSEIEWLNGIPVNKHDVTNGPAARRGTVVGCIRTDGAGQANWQPGGTGAGGTMAILGVWNMFSRMRMAGLVADNFDSWTYSVATWRAVRGLSTMRVQLVSGLAAEFARFRYVASVMTAVAGTVAAGVGVNAIAAPGGIPESWLLSGNNLQSPAGECHAQLFGAVDVQALEKGTAAGTTTWYGDNGSAEQFSGFHYDVWV